MHSDDYSVEQLFLAADIVEAMQGDEDDIREEAARRLLLDLLDADTLRKVRELVPQVSDLSLLKLVDLLRVETDDCAECYDYSHSVMCTRCNLGEHRCVCPTEPQREVVSSDGGYRVHFVGDEFPSMNSMPKNVVCLDQNGEYLYRNEYGSVFISDQDDPYDFVLLYGDVLQMLEEGSYADLLMEDAPYVAVSSRANWRKENS